MSDEVLVRYDDPPIVEVVAAVSFDPLPPGVSVQFGVFWNSLLRQDFPKVEEKPPYVPPIERFGSEVFSPQINLSLEQDFPAPRLWFSTDSGDELLQLQRDWFACNWRKVDRGSTYTHWPRRRDAFIKWYGALTGFLDSAGLGPLRVNQCEVTYINHIESGRAWKSHSEVARIFSALGESRLPDAVERENFRFNNDYLISGNSGEPVGRLHVSATPAFKASDRSPIYLLELTARGAPKTEGLPGVINFLDVARETIVKTFTSITSDELQREWGLQ